MQSQKRQYVKELKKRFGYYATWLPGTPLSLGDIGVLKKSEFIRIANLKDLKIPFTTLEDKTPSNLEYNSEGSVSITAKASGAIAPANSTLGEVDAGFIVEFGKKNSMLFKANETKNNLIEDTISLGNTVLQLLKGDKWNKDWVIITELAEAASATILISNTKNAKIELKANANANTASLDIADAQFELGATYYRGLSTKIVAENGLTPLFKVMGVKTRLFISPVFKERGIKAFDLITPETVKKDHINDLYFDYISPNDKK